MPGLSIEFYLKSKRKQVSAMPIYPKPIKIAKITYPKRKYLGLPKRLKLSQDQNIIEKWLDFSPSLPKWSLQEKFNFIIKISNMKTVNHKNFHKFY